MAIETEITEKDYAGNGVSTAFAVPFQFFELEVLAITVSTGATVTLTPGTHYTVIGGKGGTGQVTAVTPPPSGTTWLIRRRTARKQALVLQETGQLPAKGIEGALDRTIMAQQELDRQASRSLRPPTEELAGVEMTLPRKQDRAGRVLGFDPATGAPVAGPTITATEGVAGAIAAIETAAANIPAINAAPGHAATASAGAATATDQAGLAAERATAAAAAAGRAETYAQLLASVTDDYGFVGTAPDSTDDYGSL